MSPALSLTSNFLNAPRFGLTLLSNSQRESARAQRTNRTMALFKHSLKMLYCGSGVAKNRQIPTKLLEAPVVNRVSPHGEQTSIVYIGDPNIARDLRVTVPVAITVTAVSPRGDDFLKSLREQHGNNATTRQKQLISDAVYEQFLTLKKKPKLAKNLGVEILISTDTSNPAVSTNLLSRRSSYTTVAAFPLILNVYPDTPGHKHAFRKLQGFDNTPFEHDFSRVIYNQSNLVQQLAKNGLLDADGKPIAASCEHLTHACRGLIKDAGEYWTIGGSRIEKDKAPAARTCLTHLRQLGKAVVDRGIFIANQLGGNK